RIGEGRHAGGVAGDMEMQTRRILPPERIREPQRIETFRASGKQETAVDKKNFLFSVQAIAGSS
ncbi:MAG: hypothetical protein VW547_15625, partial [Alphaproteobacteria bacterium]